VRGCVR